jgi:hypothetical protein
VKRGSATELRPCLGQGAAQGEESALADSGWAGEKVAFLSIPQGWVLLVPEVLQLKLCCAEKVFPQYARAVGRPCQPDDSLQAC